MMKRLSNLVSRLWMTLHPDLGDIWTSENAEHCRSSENGDSVRVCFRNRCDYPLILCWVNSEGQPHHFYRLEPSAVNGKVQDGEHVETTQVGHAFLLAHCEPERIYDVQKSKSLQETMLVGGYRPKRVMNGDGDDDDDEEETVLPHCIHVVEILPVRRVECGGRLLRGGLAGCKRPLDDWVVDDWRFRVRGERLDLTPIDNTKMTYINSTLGGWPVRLDPRFDQVDKTMRDHLAEDLAVLRKRMPSHAVKALQSVPTIVNCSIRYGPRASPITGKGCCFHPETQWLDENGFGRDKLHCVELYDMVDYEKDRCLWGCGGVMLHEYAHAYHRLCLEDGYDNEDVLDCYRAAMKEGLYECVKVHGTQGPECKAYACKNAMEYFAELSAAFLGGVDGAEFNKWYPFNRQQIREHDPRAYAMLKRVWKIRED